MFPLELHVAVYSKGGISGLTVITEIQTLK